MEVGRGALCDASTQTEGPRELDEATKQDLLDSFAMELFLTSVMPRYAAPLLSPLPLYKHTSDLFLYTQH